MFKQKYFLFLTMMVALICMVLVSCERELRYKNDGKQVTWNTKDIWAGHHSKIVDADPSTFEDLGDGYSRDAQHAFLGRNIIKGADGKSFKCLEKRYAMDANHVFYDTIMTNADPSTFKHLGGQWYVDKDHVWWDEKPVKEADAATLQLVHLYNHFNGTTLPGPSRYAKDKNHVFLDDSTIPMSDPETFEYIQFVEGEYSIAFDKNHIYEGENSKELQEYLRNKYGRKQ